MTIDELIKWLEDCREQVGGNKNVFLSVDPEGNEYRKVDELSTCFEPGHDDTFDRKGIIIWPSDTIVELK